MPIYKNKLVNSIFGDFSMKKLILETLVLRLTTLIAVLYKSATLHNNNLIKKAL